MKSAVADLNLMSRIHDDVATKSQDCRCGEDYGRIIGTSAIVRGDTVIDEDSHCSAVEEVQHCLSGHIDTYRDGFRQMDDTMGDQQDWAGANYHTSCVHS